MVTVNFNIILIVDNDFAENSQSDQIKIFKFSNFGYIYSYIISSVSKFKIGTITDRI